MRTLPLLPLVLVALALPATASAKELSSAQVCGASGCTTVDGSARAALMGDGRPVGAPAAAPFVNVFLTMDRAHFAEVYVPSAGAVLVEDEGFRPTWMRVEPRVRAALARASAGVRPYAANRSDAMAVTAPARPRAAAHHDGGGSGINGWILPGLVLVAVVVVLELARRRCRAGGKPGTESHEALPPVQ